MRGALLIAHGSRSPEAHEACLRLARAVRDGLGGPVEVGYLELSEPDVATAGARLVAAGCTELAVVPLFVAPGRHARADVPARLAALREAHPGLRITEGPSVGDDPAFAALVLASARRSLGGTP